jgi:hypothetical protein
MNAVENAVSANAGTEHGPSRDAAAITKNPYDFRY